MGRGLYPEIFFVFVVENAIFGRILTILFLKPYANGRGSNPLIPFSVRHCSAGITVRHGSEPKLDYNSACIGDLPPPHSCT